MKHVRFPQAPLPKKSVAQKFHFAIFRIEVTRASRGLSAIAELLVVYLLLRACVVLKHGEVDLVGLEPILRTTTSFSALTLSVGSFDP